jgi:hypothetical protein
MSTGRIYWSEASAGARGRLFWSAVEADAPASLTGRIYWSAIEPEAPAGLIGRIFWSAVEADAPPTVYALTAEPGAYTMAWAGSTGQMVLLAEAGVYLMAGQSASLVAIFDVVQPTINTGDNLRFLKYQNRRPVLFPG